MKKKNEYDRRKFVTGTVAGLVAGSGKLFAQGAPETGKNLPFSGQTALITGGARGIGRAAALDLARAGANIVIFDILENIKGVRYELSTKKDLEETLKLIRAEGVAASGYKVDVRSESEVQKGFEKAIREFKKIDIVVACAGIVTLGSVSNISESGWKDVIDVTVLAPAEIARVISFLAHKDSGNITGATYDVAEVNSARLP